MHKRTGRTAAFASLVAAGILSLGATVTQAQCPTPRPAPAGPGLWIPDQTGGSSISVTLAAGSALIAGTQSDITWDTAPIAAKSNGKPNCTVNPNLKTPSGADTEKGATSFAFRPNGCSPTGTPCTAVRALVLSTGNVDPMADGSVLFTCNVTPPASGTATFTFSGVTLSDPNGLKVTDAGDQGGEIILTCGGPTPTNTTAPTPTATVPPPSPTPTTPAVTPATRTPTATATNTFTPTTGAGTPTPGLRSTLEDEGGCQIGAASHSSNGWLLLIPTVGLLVLRRRRR